ncbi:hypothetical protein ACJMK2_044635 [Sinanodonta woodiana]|uniref:PLAC domain-containing protein n=1 Tax=Sinanodonta woodiana TaxID=1069815 RepID=A0ABD3W3X1_SINWO
MDCVRVAGLILCLIQIFWCGHSQQPAASTCDLCSQQRSACRQITGIFTVTRLSKGYNPVIGIPAGACNINITELGRSDNFLALKTSSGRQILNNLWAIDPPGNYFGGGTLFKYSKRELDCPGECLHAKGPLTDNVIVQLLYYNTNPGIGYSFQLPPNVPDSAIEQIVPKIEEHHRRRHHHGDIHQQHSSSGISSAERREIDALKQGDTNGSPRERYGVDSFVDTSNGTSSLSSTKTHTVSQTHPFNRQSSQVRYASQPQYLNPFNQQYSRYQALTDRTYSRGINEESHLLERPTHVSGQRRLPPKTLEVTIPNATSETRVNSLDRFEWITSGFSECSQSCGGGVQQTVFACISASNRIVVTAENCDESTKPRLQHVLCNTEPCPPDWEMQEWSGCSVTCGVGQQTRRIECKQRISATLILSVSASNCRNPMPATVQQCELRRCASWVAEDWSQCSVDCGIGQKRRRVSCQDGDGNIVPDSECQNSYSVPVSVEACDMGSCTKQWFFSKWSRQCSSDCASGVMTRHVHCSTDTGGKVLDSFCDGSKKPATEKACQRDVPCTGNKWFSGPWSGCSVSCGSGLKTRDVVCVNEVQAVVVADNNCILSEKPNTDEPCDYHNCTTVQWYMSEWTACSLTCGGGQRRRYVHCLDEQQRPSSLCPEAEKPIEAERCNEDKCQTLPKIASPSTCRDLLPNCKVAVQARLCRLLYYQKKCCASCSAGIV